MIALTFILLPILCGIVLYVFKLRFANIFIFITEVSLFILNIYFFIKIKNEGNRVIAFGSSDSITAVSFNITNISIVLVGITILIFALTFLFSLKDTFYDTKFVFIFFTLQGLLCGIFIGNDLFNIYVLYEVSTIIVAILIMYKKDGKSIYDGMVYLLINIVAMLFFLMGIGYLYKYFGCLSITEISEQISLLDNKENLIMPYVFIFTAIGVKCAMFPMFTWLPIAHGTPSAPCAVSAVLSGIYVKSGIYLFIILGNMFLVNEMNDFYLILGLITAVVGCIFALGQRDIKTILAYSTVSQLGLIIMGLSFRDESSFYGSIYHILNHALFKSLLFLTSGELIREYRTRDIFKIRGAGRKMPLICIFTVLAIFGITGAPLFNGSISKYFIYKATVGTTYEIALTIINFGTILIFVRYLTMFVGTRKNNFNLKNINNIVHNKMIAIIILGLFCFLGGIFGKTFINLLFNMNFEISKTGMINKYIIYFISLILAYLVYKYGFLRRNIFKRLDGFSVTFNTMILLMVIYFGSLMGAFYILV